MTDPVSILAAANPNACRKALTAICVGAVTPAFGSVTKRELELLVFEALIEVGVLSCDPSVYEVMQKLRVTRGRSRSLLFDRDVRRHDTTQLDELTRDALRHPLLQAQGYAVVLDIDNPLLADHIRETLRRLGHATDGSFSPSLVKLNDDAAGALIQHYVPDADRDKVMKALYKAGVKDTSIKGALKAMLRKGASKLAGETGDAIAGDFGELVGKLFETKAEAITDAALALLASVDSNLNAPAG